MEIEESTQDVNCLSDGEPNTSDEFVMVEDFQQYLDNALQEEIERLKKENKRLVDIEDGLIRFLDDINKDKQTHGEKTSETNYDLVTGLKREFLVLSREKVNLQQAILLLREKLQETLDEKDSLTLRLSKMVAEHLTRDNPNITDLSDMNRPTKLAEKYSELYDNEWTDVIEELSAQVQEIDTDEKANIEKMLVLLKAANDECAKLLHPRRNILNTLTTLEVKLDSLAGQSNVFDDNELGTEESISMCKKAPEGFRKKPDTGEITAQVVVQANFDTDQRKCLLDMQKRCHVKFESDMNISQIIANKIATQRGIDPQTQTKLIAYIARCAHICWYMAIQEPPVVIQFDWPSNNDRFNKDEYKAYTKDGRNIDFIVWPPVYLHKDGPLLCKGIAQGKDKTE